MAAVKTAGSQSPSRWPEGGHTRHSALGAHQTGGRGEPQGLATTMLAQLGASSVPQSRGDCPGTGRLRARQRSTPAPRASPAPPPSPDPVLTTGPRVGGQGPVLQAGEQMGRAVPQTQHGLQAWAPTRRQALGASVHAAVEQDAMGRGQGGSGLSGRLACPAPSCDGTIAPHCRSSGLGRMGPSLGCVTKKAQGLGFSTVTLLRAVISEPCRSEFESSHAVYPRTLSLSSQQQREVRYPSHSQQGIKHDTHT